MLDFLLVTLKNNNFILEVSFIHLNSVFFIHRGKGKGKMILSISVSSQEYFWVVMCKETLYVIEVIGYKTLGSIA